MHSPPAPRAGMFAHHLLYMLQFMKSPTQGHYESLGCSCVARMTESHGHHMVMHLHSSCEAATQSTGKREGLQDFLAVRNDSYSSLPYFKLLPLVVIVRFPAAIGSFHQTPLYFSLQPTLLRRTLTVLELIRISTSNCLLVNKQTLDIFNYTADSAQPILGCGNT